MRQIFYSGVLAAACFLAPFSALALEVEELDFEESLELFNISVAGHDLPELLEVVPLDGRVYLSLNQMISLLRFPITVEMDGMGARATGWSFQESQTFRLASAPGEVRYSGKTEALNPDSYFFYDGMIYVERASLLRWFGLELQTVADTYEITAPQTFEIEREAQRLAARAKLKQSSEQPKDEAPLPADDYLTVTPSLLEWPNYQVTDEVKARWTDDGRTVSNRMTVQSFSELAYAQFHGTASVTMNNHKRTELSDSRMRLFDEYGESRKLGPLEVRNWQAGDISATGFPGIGGQVSGRGLSIDNQEAGYVSSVQGFILEGDALRGFEVELYRDNRLLGFQTVSDKGRYRFDDLELRPGLNVFTLKYYGPNGERFEEERRQYLGRGLQQQGKLTYDMALLQSDAPFSDLISEEKESNSSPSFLLRGEYGLGDQSALGLGLYHGPLSDRKATGVNLNFKQGAGPHYFESNLTGTDLGDMVFRQDYLGRLSWSNLDFSYSHETGNGRKGDQVRDEWTASVSRDINFFGLQEFYGKLGAGYEIQQDGDRVPSITNRISTNLSGLYLSNSLSRDFPSGGKAATEGSLGGSWKMANIRFASEVDYQLGGQESLTSANLSANYNLDHETVLSSRIRKNFSKSGYSEFNGEVNRQFDRFSLGLSLGGKSNGERSLGLKLRTNLIKDPASPVGYEAVGDKASPARGTLHMAAFLDLNGNGIQDPGEENMKSVRFKVRNSSQYALSGPDGVAVFYQISADRPVRVELDETSLSDIYMMPAYRSVEVSMRPSSVAEYRMPVNMLGDIDGYLTRNGQPAPDVVVRLFDQSGTEVAMTRTDEDGNYFFERLVNGEYTVRVDDRSGLAGMTARISEQQTLVLDNASPFAEEVNFALDRPGKSQKYADAKKKILNLEPSVSTEPKI